jgi:hypothetical protein
VNEEEEEEEDEELPRNPIPVKKSITMTSSMMRSKKRR